MTVALSLLKKESQSNRETTKEKPKRKTSAELAELAKIDLKSCKTDLSKLIEIQSMLEDIIPIAEGLYREAPTQGNGYALSNLIDKFQSVSEHISDLDDNETSELIMSDVIRPFIESMVLELGKQIKLEISNRNNLSSKAKAVMKDSFDSVFKSYGTTILSRLPELKTNLEEIL